VIDYLNDEELHFLGGEDPLDHHVYGAVIVLEQFVQTTRRPRKKPTAVVEAGSHPTT
jgi:hypothetical protein